MRTSEEKMLAVDAWRTSGLSQNEYCKTLGVKRTTFANWVSRNKRKKAVPNFVRVTFMMARLRLELVPLSGDRFKK